MASADDVVTQLQNIARQMALWVAVFSGRNVYGSFQLTAAATTTIMQTAVQSTSQISLTPTNASAAQLMGGANSLYVSAKSPGTSFTVATASGSAAAGTETFSYVIQTPQ